MPGIRLENKVAIVSGGGSRSEGIGNGRAAAVLFAREGAKVLVVDRDLAAAEDTVRMITDEGGEATAYAADVTNSSECDGAVGAALASWGHLDILHNNVGIEGAGSLLETDETFWDRVWAVNTKSMMLMSKAALVPMVEQHAGAIINISSISAMRPRGLTPYTITKGAVIALTRAMAFDHGPQGVRVNCVAPGVVYTPMVYAGGMDEEVRDRRRQASLLGIEGTAWDIGYAALYLASDEARYVTGIVLIVDGGVTVASPTRS